LEVKKNLAILSEKEADAIKETEFEYSGRLSEVIKRAL
jgi:hypothetical protein